MPTTQRYLRVEIPLQHGDCKSIQPTTERRFNNHDLPFVSKVHPTKLLADLLKRQARAAMRDVTTCPPDCVAAHIQRLRDCEDVARLAMRQGLVDEAETRLSGMQLANPSTLMDFVACIDFTRQQHRAPDFSNPHVEQFEVVSRKLDLIAGQLVRLRKGGAR